jgi:hypothetical protein
MNPANATENSGFVTHLFLSPSVARYVTDKQFITAVLLFAVVASLFRKSSNALAFPYVGYRSRWEPRALVQLRYLFGGAPLMIREGYAKVGLPRICGKENHLLSSIAVQRFNVPVITFRGGYTDYPPQISG